MKKSNKSSRGKKQPDQAPARPEDITELTEEELKQIQGGARIIKYSAGPMNARG